MPATVGQVYRLVRANVDAVGAWILTLAPGTQEIAIAVEHHHRMVATIEAVDVVAFVDSDGRYFLERPPIRQLRPVLDDAYRYSPLPTVIDMKFPSSGLTLDPVPLREADRQGNEIKMKNCRVR